MYNEKKICVIIPAYNEEKLIARVLETMPNLVDTMLVVDDRSTDRTVEIVRSIKEERSDARIELLLLEQNGGVGAAIAAGYVWARDRMFDVTAVMAGDAQMDPQELARVISPVANGTADYVKGNRFLTPQCWTKIPRVRFIGNAILTFLTKLASGYWNVMDSQCGFTAISLGALRRLSLETIYRRYGVPNDLLVKLNMIRARIAQVPVNPIYNIGEKSKMNILIVVFSLSLLLFKLFLSRVAINYGLRDFHPIFLFYFAGLSSLSIGTAGGVGILFADLLLSTNFISHAAVGYGWMMLCSVLITSGIQLLCFGIWLDMEDNRHLQQNLSNMIEEDPNVP